MLNIVECLLQSHRQCLCIYVCVCVRACTCACVCSPSLQFFADYLQSPLPFIIPMIY